MREAERREAAAVEYANALEKKRKLDLERFNKVDSEYNTKFAESVKSEMESVQKQLATAIEAGDAAAQVQANKRIAELAFEDAKLKQRASNVKQDEEPVKLSDGETYQNKLHNKCHKQILWLKNGQVKIHGLEQIEL